MDNRGQKRWRLWKSYMMIRELVTLRISGQRLLIIEYLDVAEQVRYTFHQMTLLFTPKERKF